MREEADAPPADGSMIPKIMHQMWVGPKPAPMSLIQTWRVAHPSWEHILWNEDTLRHYFPQGLYNQSHYDAMPEWNGKCDIARWEILQKFGGFFLDADAICVSPLDDYLLENDSFACYENELMRPGLIAAGYIGASENNALIRLLVQELHAKTHREPHHHRTRPEHADRSHAGCTAIDQCPESPPCAPLLTMPTEARSASDGIGVTESSKALSVSSFIPHLHPRPQVPSCKRIQSTIGEHPRASSL